MTDNKTSQGKSLEGGINDNTNIGVNEKKRYEVATELSKFLATTYTLYMKTLYYHWNVVGKEFYSLHSIFEDQYQDLHKAGDVIAERIRALGHYTPGTFKGFIEESSVNEDSDLPENSDIMVANLLKDNEISTRKAREVADLAAESGDKVTEDMMIARMSYHEEVAWFLRSISQ